MSQRAERGILIALFLVGAAVRLNNTFLFPPLRGYDAFGHFTYIWFLAETGRVPLSTAGWSFFHPPAYYAFLSAIWSAFTSVDPVLRLKIGSGVISLLGLVHAAAGYWVCRRAFPQDRLTRLLVVGLLLFLPVHLYSTAFLGNEGLNAVLCSAALVVLLRVLERPTFAATVGLGAVLGLAMLTKFSALAVVTGAIVSIVAKGIVDRRILNAGRTVGVTLAVMLCVCGWYYARNIDLYGNPFQMSRGTFLVQHVENSQPQMKRGVAEYLAFDPVIIRRPQWPRGFSLTDDALQQTQFSSIRTSVWTGMYANTWFDGFGGWVLPPITMSEESRRAGQILLLLGLIPTALMMLGLATTLQDLRKQGWDDTRVALLATFTAMLGIFVAGTVSVPIAAAVKATYFIPVAVPFGFWFAVGVRRLQEWNPRITNWFGAYAGALGLLSVAVFWQGFVFEVKPIRADATPAESAYVASFQNMQGVVYYAGGDPERARALFQAAADADWHLGYENLAHLSADAGRIREALQYLANGQALIEKTAIGRGHDRQRYVDRTNAEYENTRAVWLQKLARLDEAAGAAWRAVELDPSMPEALYNAAVTRLVLAETQGRVGAVEGKAIAGMLERASHLDPGLTQARPMQGVVLALLGDCETAHPFLSGDLSGEPNASKVAHRAYPVQTGNGGGFWASIGRRRLINDLPSGLDPQHRLEQCTAALRTFQKLD